MRAKLAKFFLESKDTHKNNEKVNMKDTKVLLGVTGGIAAYKSAELCRMFVKEGAQVQVVMSEAACEFITPLTMETLSGHSVHVRMFDRGRQGVAHIELGDEADFFVIAPATADFLARTAVGRASDLLSAIALAYTGQVLAAPAMNTNMWENPATKRNLRILEEEHGWIFEQPGEGDLACGWTGPGRMAEPSEIFARTKSLLTRDLADHTLLVTAGPTVEDIDPVRFLSNRSSGRMGFAVAAAASERGANVVLVSGPTNLRAPKGCELIRVRGALEMQDVVSQRAEACEAVIMAAAVADFRPLITSDQKLKKTHGEEERVIKLKRNPDILGELGKRFKGKKTPILVGFALETENLVASAKKKLETKGAAIIVANLAADGFGGENNQATILDDKGLVLETGHVSKRALADRLIDLIKERISN